jgi:2'-5' RNA ligase
VGTADKGVREKMRLFFAIELTTDVRAAIQELIVELKKNNPKEDIRWVKSANLHLTLQFLGHVAPADLEGIIRAVKKGVIGLSPFVITLEKNIFFPSKRKAHVIALSVQASQEIHALEQRLRHCLDACGQKTDTRKYKPHLSLARIHDGLSAHRIQLATIDPMPLPVDHFNLYLSEATDAGRHYQVLARFELKKLSE